MACRSGAALQLPVLLAAAAGGGGAAAAPMHAVRLFRRPDDRDWTGRMRIEEEGIEVLRRQTSPFSIISILGPTRTGKSTLLGRAFLRGENENAFRIGSGVTSYTAGVWITSEPLVVPTPSGPLRVFIIDTEGFGSIGDRMSRTYEANLFASIYMMSNAVLYNTMFPVDAGAMDRINIYCSQLMTALRALEDGGVGLHRHRPKLVWALQGFNEYNLRNSDITTEQFLQRIINASDDRGPTSKAQSNAAMDAVGAAGSRHLNQRLIGQLFHPVQLVTVRRPHDDDGVVANMHQHGSASLSQAYLQDADHLRMATLEGLQPGHFCETGKDPARRAGSYCKMKLWDGPAFVNALTEWFTVGHIDLDSTDEANETSAVEKFATAHDKWFDGECRQVLATVRRYMRSKKKYSEHKGSSRRPEPRDASRRVPAKPIAGLMSMSKADFMQAMLARIRALQKQAMLRAVQRAQFWQFPARIATFVETQTKLQAMQCMSQLFEVKREAEGPLTPAEIKKMRPKVAPGKAAVVRVTRTERKVEAERLKNVARIEELQELLSMGEIKPGTLKQLGTAREECFVIYD